MIAQRPAVFFSSCYSVFIRYCPRSPVEGGEVLLSSVVCRRLPNDSCLSPRFASNSPRSSVRRGPGWGRSLQASPRSTGRCRTAGCPTGGSPRSSACAAAGRRRLSGRSWPPLLSRAGGWPTSTGRGRWLLATGPWPVARGASGSSVRLTRSAAPGALMCCCGAGRSAWWCSMAGRRSRGRSPSGSRVWPANATPRWWSWATSALARSWAVRCGCTSADDRRQTADGSRSEVRGPKSEVHTALVCGLWPVASR